MKVLVILFLAGFVLAEASPLYDLGQVGGFGEFADELAFAADDTHILEEVKAKLKEKFDNFLKKVRDALNGGKEIKDEVLNKAKEIKEKFKILKEQLDKEGNDFLKTLLDHGRGYLKKIFEKLGVNDKQDIEHHVEAILQAEEKDDIVKNLKDKFQEYVDKIKDALEKGKNIKDSLDILQNIRQKLKEYNIDLDVFGKDYLEQLKDKVKDYWKKLKERLGVSKRNADIDVFGMVEEFKKMIKEKFDPERIKSFVEKYFGKNRELIERITQFIKENGKESLGKFREIARLFFKDMMGPHKNSTNNVFEELEDFFKDLGLEIKERFTKFGEWVKEQYKKGLQKSKDRLEGIRSLAKEFMKKIPRDTAKEALEFFRKYKKDLGVLFDEMEAKVKQILKQD